MGSAWVRIAAENARLTRPAIAVLPGRDASEEFEGSPDGSRHQGPWLPVRHRFSVSGPTERPRTLRFFIPGGSCAAVRFASRPGGGITPVSQWRLACLAGLTVSPSLRRHAGNRPGDLEFRTSPKTSLAPGQGHNAPGSGGVGKSLTLFFAGGVQGRGYGGALGASFETIATMSPRLPGRRACDPSG
jgi:hypothetical protein